MKKIAYCLLLIAFMPAVNSCNRDYGCTSFADEITASYDSPVWHPNGQILGFNRLPLKAVGTVNQGACGSYYTYSYYNDSIGFWLINKDGSNLRRSTAFQLLNPAWSPDGKWIVFCNGGTIYKMPFDGSNFDTSHITALTANAGGSSLYPSWGLTSDTIYYEFDSSNGIGYINKIPINGTNPVRVVSASKYVAITEPYVTANGNILHIRGVNQIAQVFIMDANGNNPRQITTNVNNIAYAGKNHPRYYNGNIYFEDFGVWRINAGGTGLQQLFSQSAQGFSIAADGTIAYINYNYKILDKTHGVIWLMDSNGNNQRQLTFNYIP